MAFLPVFVADRRGTKKMRKILNAFNTDEDQSGYFDAVLYERIETEKRPA
jgi:hypothetical protein